MGEGQTHGAGPVTGRVPGPLSVPAVVPAPVQAPVLPYADGLAQCEDPEWRDLPDGVEFKIPPPAVGRQVVAPTLALVVAIPLALFAWLGAVAAARNLAFVGTALTLVALGVMALRWAFIASRRLRRAANHGARPTVITTSSEWLTMESPWLPEDRAYRLPRGSITGLRLDEVNVLPAVVRSVRLRVILRHDDFFDLRFPWRANFSLAHAEWRLHDAMGLGPRNFAPPVASVRRES